MHICKVISDAAKLEEEGISNIADVLDEYYTSNNNNKHTEE